MEQTHPDFFRADDADTRFTDTLHIEQQRYSNLYIRVTKTI